MVFRRKYLERVAFCAQIRAFIIGATIVQRMPVLDQGDALSVVEIFAKYALVPNSVNVRHRE
jgi:hypothetical protein